MLWECECFHKLFKIWSVFLLDDIRLVYQIMLLVCQFSKEWAFLLQFHV